MTTEEKIKEAANRQEKVLNGSLKSAWIEGALSEEAKKHWQQGMYTEADLICVMRLGMELRQNQLSCHDDRSGKEVLREWISRKLL